jgi:hypothetical protein
MSEQIKSTRLEETPRNIELIKVELAKIKLTLKARGVAV